MTLSNSSAFPLILADKNEVLTILKIEASENEKNLLKNSGLIPDTLIQLLEKTKDNIFILFVNGKTIHLSFKLARMIRVTLCPSKEKSFACAFCLHKGSCHGN